MILQQGRADYDTGAIIGNCFYLFLYIAGETLEIAVTGRVNGVIGRSLGIAFGRSRYLITLLEWNDDDELDAGCWGDYFCSDLFK